MLVPNPFLKAVLVILTAQQYKTTKRGLEREKYVVSMKTKLNVLKRLHNVSLGGKILLSRWR